jgi:hypothetical protein
LFLTGLPTLERLCFSTKTESCCSSCHDKSSLPPKPCNDNQDEQGNDICNNPFLNCHAAGCYYTLAVQQYFPIVHWFTTKENNYIEVFSPQIVLPIWQPPKIS